MVLKLQQYLPLAVLKRESIPQYWNCSQNVATVLTACGIETFSWWIPFLPSIRHSCNSTYRLRYWNSIIIRRIITYNFICCNSTYRLRYWNALKLLGIHLPTVSGCNSTYRLRYWNKGTSRSVTKTDKGCNSTYRLRYWNTGGAK